MSSVLYLEYIVQIAFCTTTTIIILKLMDIIFPGLRGLLVTLFLCCNKQTLAKCPIFWHTQHFAILNSAAAWPSLPWYPLFLLPQCNLIGFYTFTPMLILVYSWMFYIPWDCISFDTDVEYARACWKDLFSLPCPQLFPLLNGGSRR